MIKPTAKGPSDDSRIAIKDRAEFRQPPLGQPGVGVQEQQYIAPCLLDAQIELGRPLPDGGDHHTRTEISRNLPGPVGAAAVGQDHFDPGLNSPDRPQARRKPQFLIPRRHNDGHTGHWET